MRPSERRARAHRYIAFLPTPSPSEHAQHEFTAGIAAPRSARLLDIAIGAALVRVNRRRTTRRRRCHRSRGRATPPDGDRVVTGVTAQRGMRAVGSRPTRRSRRAVGHRFHPGRGDSGGCHGNPSERTESVIEIPGGPARQKSIASGPPPQYSPTRHRGVTILTIATPACTCSVARGSTPCRQPFR